MPRLVSPATCRSTHGGSHLARPGGSRRTYAGVVAEVLGHGFAGVEPDFAEMQAASVIFGRVGQTRADPAALHIGPDGNGVQQQVAGLGDQDGTPGVTSPPSTASNALQAADRLHMAGGYRGRAWPILET